MINDHQFETGDVLAKQLADAVSARLEERVQEKGKACLAVSGGTTPVQFFKELARRDLPWSRILVTLVDERWVDEQHESSNAALVREYLLSGKASQSCFLPLKNSASSPKDGFMDCENRLQEQMIRLDVAVFGMGEDGHTASWFPHSDALPACLDDTSHSWTCPVEDDFLALPRMTLTWAFISQCQHLFLHFEGAKKQAVFDAAVSDDELQNIAELPVRRLIAQQDVPLSIYRCAS